MTDAAPRLSVLMPTYQAERFVAEAIESLLRQSFRDFELLVFDDGSSDATPRIVASLAARDCRIAFYAKPHAGHTTWLREGLEMARGEYVARMDADDVAHPERFARQVAYLDAHPDCVVLGAEVLLVDPERRPIRAGGVRPDHAAIDAELMRGNGAAIVHPAAVFRREVLLAAGGYRPEFEPAEDLDLFLRLAERGRLANLPETLLEYRQHTGAVGNRRAGLQRRQKRAVLEDAARRRGRDLSSGVLGPPTPERRAAVEVWHGWARAALGAGRRATARHYALRVLRAEPRSAGSWRLLARALFGLRLGALRSRRKEPGSGLPLPGSTSQRKR